MADNTQKISGLFSRWTQRREQVAAEEALETQKIQDVIEDVTSDTEVASTNATTASPSPEIEHQSQEDPNRILTAEDLPNPEEIEIGGSFASFMAANVDPAVKTAALRALWKQPHFNEIDGLLEYALDYSNQTKLTPEVSAELAKKVFRYMTKDNEDSDEEATLVKNELNSVPETAMGSDNEIETELAAKPLTDNLDGEIDDLPQNAPELSAQVHPRVV
ncbi:Protein of uncharacterised function (DUF3306) [Shewanella putrefaciens]|uniref:DUF3306 domain-containing protein n=1 Tax=Shewanella putrefaciens TaxID=24 RepID=UPI000E04863D|nr:DUF3306 domain-containing protein [Shewanella putrefaciens]SUI79418.1 Protein of uncharacterised function (DUF3306) [Shewanella putrefaciens]